jgi:formylmethanofuran dehydrogenase subunit E
MICITIIAIALAGYFARRAKLIDKHRIRESLKHAETEIALRRSLKNVGKEYEKIKAHSVARCGKCGRLYTWKQVADLGNYYVCKNCEAKQYKITERQINENNKRARN